MYFIVLLLFITASRARFRATVAERPNWRLHE